MLSVPKTNGRNLFSHWSTARLSRSLLKRLVSDDTLIRVLAHKHAVQRVQHLKLCRLEIKARRGDGEYGRLDEEAG